MSFTKVPCGQTKSCRANVFVIDGKRFVYNGTELKEHDCVAFEQSRKSSLPTEVFVGVWKNANTGRIRYVGPFKKERQARTEPDSHNYWILIEVKGAIPRWETMEDDFTIYRRKIYGNTVKEIQHVSAEADKEATP